MSSVCFSTPPPNHQNSRHRFSWSPELYTAGFGCFDVLSLALADPFALALGDKGQDLEDEVRDKRSHEVFALSGVKEGHIKDDDINALFFGEDAPLFLDFFVAVAEAVGPHSDLCWTLVHSRKLLPSSVPPIVF